MSVIYLGGRPIHLRRSAERLQVNHTYLSKVLSGKRDPDTLRVGFVRRMATFFEFSSMEDLLLAIVARREALEHGAAPETAGAPGGAEVITSHLGPSLSADEDGDASVSSVADPSSILGRGLIVGRDGRLGNGPGGTS